MPFCRPSMYAIVNQLSLPLRPEVWLTSLRYYTHRRLQERRKRCSTQIPLRPSRLLSRLSGPGSVDRGHRGYLRCQPLSSHSIPPLLDLPLQPRTIPERKLTFHKQNRATVHSAIFDVVDVRYLSILFPCPFPQSQH